MATCLFFKASLSWSCVRVSGSRSSIGTGVGERSITWSFWSPAVDKLDIVFHRLTDSVGHLPRSRYSKVKTAIGSVSAFFPRYVEVRIASTTGESFLDQAQLVSVVDHGI